MFDTQNFLGENPYILHCRCSPPLMLHWNLHPWLEAFNNMLFEGGAVLCPGWSNNKCLWFSIFISVIEESVFWSLADRGVLPRCVFTSELQGVGQCQAGERWEQVRAVWRGWMFVRRRGNKACSRGWHVKVLSCSEGGLRERNSFLWHFQSEKRTVKNPGSSCQSHYIEERKWGSIHL